MKAPLITQELIEYLDFICPDAAPSLKDSDREVWFKAGKVNLVQHLRSVHEEQHQSILEGN